MLRVDLENGIVDKIKHLFIRKRACEVMIQYSTVHVVELNLITIKRIKLYSVQSALSCRSRYFVAIIPQSCRTLIYFPVDRNICHFEAERDEVIKLTFHINHQPHERFRVPEIWNTLSKRPCAQNGSWCIWLELY